MATIRATGASLLNTVDINANNISVFDNKQSKYININKVYVHDSQIIEATQNENKKYEYPSEDINDNNISGLHSMINYINTHTGKKPNYYFYEDNSNINIKKNDSKKNVFAKFKSYNKDAGGKISMAPPKNSISKQVSENDMILLKERANRYTYEGKFANFNFLQKIEKKIFNKKLGLSFAEFKKLGK